MESRIPIDFDGIQDPFGGSSEFGIWNSQSPWDWGSTIRDPESGMRQPPGFLYIGRCFGCKLLL